MITNQLLLVRADELSGRSSQDSLFELQRLVSDFESTPRSLLDDVILFGRRDDYSTFVLDVGAALGVESNLSAV